MIRHYWQTRVVPFPLGLFPPLSPARRFYVSMVSVVPVRHGVGSVLRSCGMVGAVCGGSFTIVGVVFHSYLSSFAYRLGRVLLAMSRQ